MNNFVVSTRKKELVCPEESLSSPVTTSTNVGKDFEPDKNLQPYIYSKIQGELNKNVVEGDINTYPLKMLSLEQKWSSVTDEETVNVFTLEKMDALEEFVLKIHTMKVKGQISDCQTFRLGRVFAIIGHEKFHAPRGKASTVVFLASILEVLPLSS